MCISFKFDFFFLSYSGKRVTRWLASYLSFHSALQVISNYDLSLFSSCLNLFSSPLYWLRVFRRIYINSKFSWKYFSRLVIGLKSSVVFFFEIAIEKLNFPLWLFSHLMSMIDLSLIVGLAFVYIKLISKYCIHAKNHHEFLLFPWKKKKRETVFI